MSYELITHASLTSYLRYDTISAAGLKKRRRPAREVDARDFSGRAECLFSLRVKGQSCAWPEDARLIRDGADIEADTSTA